MAASSTNGGKRRAPALLAGAAAAALIGVLPTRAAAAPIIDYGVPAGLCLAIGSKAGVLGCAGGLVLGTILNIVWDGTIGAWAGVDDQGNRVILPDNYATNFSGIANGQVAYSGVRTGPIISGGYSGPEGEGTFSGTINRNGTVSGTYVEEEERGSFAGTATPGLTQAFGNATCTSGCDE